MSLVVNPLRVPALYDILTVAGYDNPGIFILVSGGERGYKWDRKDPAGAQGATSTYRGWNVSTGIKGKFVFWTAVQIDEFFSTFISLFQLNAESKEPKPIEVFHPVLFANGITAVSVDSIGPLVDEGNGKQLWSVTIEMSEFRPAPKKNATATPKEPIVMSDPHGDPNPGKPDVNETLRNEIAKELEMARRPLPE